MQRRVTYTLTLAVLCLMAPAVMAADDAAKKPIGTWTKVLGDNKIVWTIKADGLTVVVTNGTNSIEVDCDYSLTKNGETVYMVITKVTAKGIEGPTKGDPYSFDFKAEKNILTLSNFKGTDNADVKQLIQGEYTKAK
jgi:hypothetical protein